DRHEGPDRTPAAACCPAAGRPHLLRGRQGLWHLHPAGPGGGRGLPDQRGDPRPHRPGGGHPGRRGSVRLHRPARPRHPARRRPRPAGRDAARRRHRPVRHLLRPPPHRIGAGLRDRPAGGDPQRRLRLLGAGRPGTHAGAVPPLGGGQPRLHPVLRRARLDQRPHDAHRRPGAGGHDPADHLGHRPRGVQPGAGPAPRGRTRAGGHPLGDDQDGGAALRQVRRHRRRDARSRPGARRDDGGRDHPVRWRRRHGEPDQQLQPLHDRVEHRAAVPGGHRGGRQHPDRQRAGAVRHHARGQHARPVHRQPARRFLRSQL
ncbi:MAG: Phosphate transport system permease protein PstC, partial [uncultured Blastococcus sp.]